LIYRPAPHVSATSWVVLDRKSRQILFGKLEKERKEIASLTKIMTIYTVRKLSERLGVPLDTEIVISEDDAAVTGTSAMLVPGDTLTIEELMYGLMLPSGNDAAHCLAFYFGSLLLGKKKK